jgi:DivIVA domain-containing protein
MKKKGKNVRFKLKLRGYDVKEVENYIKTCEKQSEDVQLEQKERIAQLKEQCVRLNAELESLRSREEQIKATLVNATEKAEKMTADINRRYINELERLKLFRAKWKHAYEEMSERYHFSKDALNMESVAVSTELEIRKFLAQDFSLDKGEAKDEMEEHFDSEVERLTRAVVKASEPKSAEKDLRDRLSEAGERKNKAQKRAEEAEIGAPAAFSIEDALSPTESLAEICQYLGLGKRA